MRPLKWVVTLFCLLSASVANALTVATPQGPFTLDRPVKRVVALEFSFVDALAAIGVSPVGVADDLDPNRLLPAVRAKISPWQSVGTRSQPSLEAIAALKPDLIIADWDRHRAMADALNKIAPTLFLASRRVGYEQTLQAAETIAAVLGQREAMNRELARHRQVMSEKGKQLASWQGQVQFAVARENGLFIHAPDSFAAGVIQALGLKVPPMAKRDSEASRQVSLEQLLALNPDYLVIGRYSEQSTLDRWQKDPMWRLLKAAQPGHLIDVDGNNWARSRGILAAESMADDLIRARSH